MASAGVWGAISQTEGVTQNATQVIERVRSNQSYQHKPDESSTNSSDDYEKDHGNEKVASLARQLTQHSIKNPDGTYPNPFIDSNDPALDPRSGQFNPEVWTRTLLGFAIFMIFQNDAKN